MSKMKHRSTSDGIIDGPVCYYEKRIIYKGWIIGLIQYSARSTGGLYLFDENGRFRMHAILSNGAAWTTETEQMAKDTVDEMIADTFPPTAGE